MQHNSSKNSRAYPNLMLSSIHQLSYRRLMRYKWLKKTQKPFFNSLILYIKNTICNIPPFWKEFLDPTSIPRPSNYEINSMHGINKSFRIEITSSNARRGKLNWRLAFSNYLKLSEVNSSTCRKVFTTSNKGSCRTNPLNLPLQWDSPRLFCLQMALMKYFRLKNLILIRKSFTPKLILE